METPSFSDILYKPDMQTFKQVLDTEIKVPKINVKNPLFALYTRSVNVKEEGMSFCCYQLIFLDSILLTVLLA